MPSVMCDLSLVLSMVLSHFVETTCAKVLESQLLAYGMALSIVRRF